MGNSYIDLNDTSAVTVTGTVQVEAASLPLPDGAATSAQQLPNNHQVTVSNFPVSQAVTGPLTDSQLRAAAVPVSAASLPLPAGAATNAAQLPNNHQVAVSNFPATQPVSGPLTDVQLRALAVAISAATLPLPAGASTSALQLPNNHQVTVSNFPATQPVSATSLPLPAGAATSAAQLPNNHQVQVSNFPAIQAVSGPLTDAQLRASAVPVSAATLPLPAGASTAALQLPNNHQVQVSNFPAVQVVSGPLTDAQLRAAVVPVQVSNFPATQPISAISLPLPTGAATAALQTQPGVDIGDVTVNNTSGQPVPSSLYTPGGVSLLGQKMAAQSIPVVLASDRGGVQGLVDNNFMFAVSADVSAATAGVNNPLLLLRNPAGSGKTIYLFRGYAGCTVANVSVSFKIFGAATVTTNGTAIPVVSRNVGGGSPASVILASTLPTVSASGDQLAGLVTGQNSNSIIFGEEFSIAVRAGSNCLVTGNPLSNGRNCVVSIIWQEV